MADCYRLQGCSTCECNKPSTCNTTPKDIMSKLRYIDITVDPSLGIFDSCRNAHIYWVDIPNSNLIAPTCTNRISPIFQDGVYHFKIPRSFDIFHGFSLSPVLKEEVKYVRLYANPPSGQEWLVKEWTDVSDNFVYQLYNDYYPLTLDPFTKWSVEFELRPNRYGVTEYSVCLRGSVLTNDTRAILTECQKPQRFACDGFNAVGNYDGSCIIVTTVLPHGTD